MTPLYQTKASATGGRNGQDALADGSLTLALAIPAEMGGPGGAGKANPEQLFALGYAACFDSALNFVASQKKVPLTRTQVDATVGIGRNTSGGFALSVKLDATIDGPDRATAQQLLEAAHQVCPYSNALRGNVDVTLTLV